MATTNAWANYPEGEIKEQMTIRPYEAFVLEK